MSELKRSPLRKLEERFGRIKSEDQAQQIADVARTELVRRKKELLFEFRKRINVEQKGLSVIITIPDLNGNYFAILKGRLMQDGFFHIVLVSVGELEGQGDQSNFKYRDPLRKLGVDKLLMDYTIKWARMNGHNGITLECKYNLMDHYKKFGFVEDHIPQSDYYESLGEWRTMTLNFN